MNISSTSFRQPSGASILQLAAGARSPLSSLICKVYGEHSLECGARPGPPSLDRKSSTPQQAQRALHHSTEDLARLFDTAFAARQARVKGMPRRAVNMLAYLIQHDAHHRGQICLLARDLGHEFKSEDTMRIWGWKALPTIR